MNKTVHLDFGHGGKDPGALGQGLKEKDIVLDIGLKTGEILEQRGVKVTYSRTKDEYISPSKRAKMANAQNADIFVSLHTNAYDGDTRGVEIFHYPNKNEGRKLATSILDNIIKNQLYTRNRGIKTDTFTVLKRTKMTAALVELGFITDFEDANILKNKQDEFAEAIADGIINYLGVKNVTKSPSKPKSKPRPQHEKTWRNYINGQIVRDLQRELNRQFNAGLKVDGWFGDNTIDALVTVRRGARGNLTRIIQRRLMAKGYKLRYGADGVFGQETYNRVRQFQQARGLAVDGIVGKNTWKALFRK